VEELAEMSNSTFLPKHTPASEVSILELFSVLKILLSIPHPIALAGSIVQCVVSGVLVDNNSTKTVIINADK
jgi:hypothetical protein